MICDKVRFGERSNPFFSLYEPLLINSIQGLRQRTLAVPIMPSIQSHLDTSNFDEYPMDAEGPPPDDVSGWDEHF